MVPPPPPQEVVATPRADNSNFADDMGYDDLHFSNRKAFKGSTALPFLVTRQMGRRLVGDDEEGTIIALPPEQKVATPNITKRPPNGTLRTKKMNSNKGKMKGSARRTLSRGNMSSTFSSSGQPIRSRTVPEQARVTRPLTAEQQVNLATLARVRSQPDFSRGGASVGSTLGVSENLLRPSSSLGTLRDSSHLMAQLQQCQSVMSGGQFELGGDPNHATDKMVAQSPYDLKKPESRFVSPKPAPSISIKQPLRKPRSPSRKEVIETRLNAELGAEEEVDADGELSVKIPLQEEENWQPFAEDETVRPKSALGASSIVSTAGGIQTDTQRIVRLSSAACLSKASYKPLWTRFVFNPSPELSEGVSSSSRHSPTYRQHVENQVWQDMDQHRAGLVPITALDMLNTLQHDTWEEDESTSKTRQRDNIRTASQKASETRNLFNRLANMPEASAHIKYTTGKFQASMYSHKGKKNRQCQHRPAGVIRASRKHQVRKKRLNYSIRPTQSLHDQPQQSSEVKQVQRQQAMLAGRQSLQRQYIFDQSVLDNIEAERQLVQKPQTAAPRRTLRNSELSLQSTIHLRESVQSMHSFHPLAGKLKPGLHHHHPP